MLTRLNGSLGFGSQFLHEVGSVEAIRDALLSALSVTLVTQYSITPSGIIDEVGEGCALQALIKVRLSSTLHLGPWYMSLKSLSGFTRP